ncbi:MAG: 4Fe-4S dicluster domain-containing protein [Chloroflexi bacterium]|nr:4Fe-4S dicluster domain-containing protein [Chloroflexota bacterium]
MTLNISSNTKYVLESADFQQLIDVLVDMGYRVIGPTLDHNAVTYDDITSVTDLPIGWTDEQNAATYRLISRADEAFFGYVIAPQSWKKFLYPSQVRLWQATLANGSFEVAPEPEKSQPMAFIGVRACELHAIAIQDKIFLEGDYVDPTYHANRENLFMVAVNCGQAGGTCFCTSVNTGPKVETGYDLALTEVIDPETHYFVVEIGTERGRQVVEQLSVRAADKREAKLPKSITDQTATQMKRYLNTDGIKELLYANFENARWDDIAQRCLACTNCTMVCPTCFCTTVEDMTDLTGQQAERTRKWDSCFTMDFSYIHGGSVRYTSKSRYRQWMTHKLATWIDQFGTLGCVGCGRCITWCPAGIDITAELEAIRQTKGTAEAKKEVSNENVG